jgi:RNA polymerase sigma factor (TIGR02999 family)
MGQSDRGDVTRMLLEVGAKGAPDSPEADRLYEILHGELHNIAAHLMRQERVDHTLQPTALVHEAYLKLVDQTQDQWQNRAHFYGIAARAMRQVLVDHARRHLAQKRGGGWKQITLDENLGMPPATSLEIMALHDALEKLACEDERMARVVELRVFAGAPGREIAHLLGVSLRTVEGDWKVAKMWLGREISGGDGP